MCVVRSYGKESNENITELIELLFHLCVFIARDCALRSRHVNGKWEKKKLTIIKKTTKYNRKIIINKTKLCMHKLGINLFFVCRFYPCGNSLAIAGHLTTHVLPYFRYTNDYRCSRPGRENVKTRKFCRRRVYETRQP